MEDFSTAGIISALRNKTGGLLGETDEQRMMAEKIASEAKAKKLIELQAKQAEIDKENEYARRFGMSLTPDVIVNGVPVEETPETQPISDTTEPAPPLGNDSKSIIIQTVCEHEWEAQADMDEGRKADFMASCIASKRGVGYN